MGIFKGMKSTYTLHSDNWYNILTIRVLGEKRLRRLQRQVSRKYEMNKEGNRFVKTSNIIKIEKEIRQLHRRLSICHGMN